MGYAKVIHKKDREEERRIEKNGQVSEVLKNGYLDTRLKKEMNKIAHVFLQMFPSFKREICFQGAL